MYFLKNPDQPNNNVNFESVLKLGKSTETIEEKLNDLRSI